MDEASSMMLLRVTGFRYEEGTATQLLGALADGAQAHQLYAVRGARSGETPIQVEVDKQNDVVVLKIASGPLLVLAPESAKALLSSGSVTERCADEDAKTRRKPVNTAKRHG